jgi:hypothetical protein
MSNAISDGGKKVLDIYARNEAIQLTWIQAYLKMDDTRPTWAQLADEIFRNDAPGEPKSIIDDQNARTNQFPQTWHSRMKTKLMEGGPHDRDLCKEKTKFLYQLFYRIQIEMRT